MPPDGHIRLLPNHVANKIAAGEVVERPASVLKELLENALDAGATRIDVSVTAGGRTLVSVRDNGCGMNREDALLSLERHATSKIRDVDDIERISTLGFRGEAIPSIASVSRFTLTTRRADSEEGTRIVVNAGTLAEVKTCGTPPGTCIEVRDLFCNVPARRKFLRAFVTEEGHIRATFTVHALAHPDVGFSLTLDGREAYRLPPGATLEERIRALFGAPFAESLVPVISDVGSVHVHGYAERPGHDANLRRDQFVFVNGRPATAASITYALREAYPRQRAEARPAVVLFIDLPPEQVDVNVHPSKREVRFRRSADVRDALLAAFAPQNEKIGATGTEMPGQDSIGVTAPEMVGQDNIGVAGLSARKLDAGVPPASPPAPFTAPFQPSLPPVTPPVLEVALKRDAQVAGETPATP
ncbi:MAG: DNA mismatch repair endonuclease MutL, partial [Kiritimatiellae bacterium]|nr:DNA mismatch repair endonuclease MutL [Kiritimatiellia bacterium]